MLHLSTIKLRNFKAHASLELKIAPLTFLLGANSAGKSSLIQSLKMVTTSIQAGGNATFPLNGELASLGTFKEIRNASAAGSSAIGLEFYFESYKRHKILQTIDNPIAFRQEGDSAHFKIEILQGKFESQARIQRLSIQRGALSLALDAQAQGDSYDVRLARTEQGQLLTAESDLVYKPFDYVGLVDGVMNSSQHLSEADRNSWWEGEYKLHLRSGLNGRVTTSSHLFRLFCEYFEGEYPQGVSNSSTPGQLNLADFLEMWKEEANSLSNAGPTIEEWAFNLESNLNSRLSARREYLESSLVEEPEAKGKLSKSLNNILRAAYEEQISRLKPPLAHATEEEISTALRVFMADNSVPELGIFYEPVQLEYDKGNQDSEYGDLKLSEFNLLSAPQSLLGKKVKFLGPLRIDGFSQQKSSSAPNPALPVGIAGELTAQKVLDDPKRGPYESKYPVPGGQTVSSLREALDAWIKHIEVGEKITTRDLGSRGVAMALDGMEIHQVGTGVSQVVPVLVACLDAVAGDLVVIEQPELHLHPAAQQKLADFFMAIVSNGGAFAPRLIVETHSEYFINRLRRGVVMGTFDPENSTLAFFENSATGTKVRQLTPSESGGFDDWPTGFFAQTESDLLDILEALEGDEQE